MVCCWSRMLSSCQNGKALNIYLKWNHWHDCSDYGKILIFQHVTPFRIEISTALLKQNNFLLRRCAYILFSQFYPFFSNLKKKISVINLAQCRCDEFTVFLFCSSSSFRTSFSSSRTNNLLLNSCNLYKKLDDKLFLNPCTKLSEVRGISRSMTDTPMY